MTDQDLRRKLQQLQLEDRSDSVDEWDLIEALFDEVHGYHLAVEGADDEMAALILKWFHTVNKRLEIVLIPIEIAEKAKGAAWQKINEIVKPEVLRSQATIDLLKLLALEFALREMEKRQLTTDTNKKKAA